MRVDLDDLVSVHEIAERYGIRSNAVSNWQKRYPDFPQPVAAWSKGRFKLWRLADVETWFGRHWSESFVVYARYISEAP